MRPPALTTRSCLAAILIALSAMTGHGLAQQLARPSPTDYLLGHSRVDEILERFGTPTRDAVVEREGRSLRLVAYASSEPGEAHAEGIRPARTLAFVFHEGVLVGDTYASSYEEDHTDFDERLARGIVRGRSTYADVIGLLGRPAGWRIWPLTPGRDQKLIVYTYVQLRNTPQGLLRFRKTLTVTYGRNDIVTAARLQVTGRR